MEENSANQRPTADYNSVCQLLGHLYVELNNVKIKTEAHYRTVIENLSEQVSSLISENETLRSESSGMQESASLSGFSESSFGQESEAKVLMSDDDGLNEILQ